MRRLVVRTNRVRDPAARCKLHMIWVRTFYGMGANRMRDAAAGENSVQDAAASPGFGSRALYDLGVGVVQPARGLHPATSTKVTLANHQIVLLVCIILRSSEVRFTIRFLLGIRGDTICMMVRVDQPFDHQRLGI